MSEARSTALPDGIRVVTERMSEVRSVAIGFWVGVGSRDETPEQAGITHFVEHLLFKGTQRWTARQIAEAVDAAGGEMNAFTAKEYTCYYARVLDDDLPLALDILGDITRSPAFDPEDIELERGVILEEIRAHEDDPDDVVDELFFDTLWPEHPLGRSILGTRETVAAASRDGIETYFSGYYRPENMVVAAAGNVDHDELVAAIEAAFEGLSGGRHPRHTSPGSVTSRVSVATRPTEQARLVLGMPGFSYRDPDRYALTVMNQVLGGSTSSRLFQEIREKRGLAYAVYSYRAFFDETGSFGVYVGTTPGQAREVLRLVLDEFEALRSDGISDDELARAKGHLKGGLALSLEDSGSRMTRLGRGVLLADELLSIDELVARVDGVGADDVARVADRVLGSDCLILSAVGPFEAADFEDLVPASAGA